MDRTAFSRALREATLSAWREFRRRHHAESPYAFALVVGRPLGFAVATEEGLRRVVDAYERRGYRYRGREWEAFDNREMLAAWLRWANPDDGWHRADFPEDSEVARHLGRLVEAGAFEDADEDLEDACTEALASLRAEPAWLAACGGREVVVGVTSGEDPRDFLRTATRVNPHRLVRRLWREFAQGEELSGRIPSPGSSPD